MSGSRRTPRASAATLALGLALVASCGGGVFREPLAQAKPAPTPPSPADSAAGALARDAGGAAEQPAIEPESADADAGTAPSSDQPAVRPRRCPDGLSGPALVPVTSGGIAFCIDATEVTNQHYAAFLAQAGAPSQPAECSWNLDLVPDGPAPAWPLPARLDQRPVVFVDWCDAHAYCRWAHKRLCGRQGGGVLPIEAGGHPTGSEWAVACTSGGEHHYPYGDRYDPAACNTESRTAEPEKSEDVASRATCQARAPFAAIYDLVGNVAEWLDACDGRAGKVDRCVLAGGSFYRDDLTPEQMSCSESTHPEPRDNKYQTIGFRCCADALP